jgi:DNA primase
MDNTERIKSELSIQEVCEGYGVHFNGKIALCPFHNDHHPSANIRLDNQTFHCTPCGIHVDIFGFVQELFNIDFKQAISKLDADFHLNLSTEPLSRAEQEKQNNARLERLRAVEVYRSEYNMMEREFKVLRELIRFKPKDLEQAETKAKAVARLYYLDYWLSENFWR